MSQKSTFEEIENTTTLQKIQSQDQPYIKDISLTGDSLKWQWRMLLILTPSDMQNLNTTALLLEILSKIVNISAHDSNLYIIFSELYVNALDHGILQLDSRTKHNMDGFFEYFKEREKRLASLEEGEIKIELRLNHQDNERYELIYQISDSGKGFLPPLKLSENEATDKFSGRGLKLTRKICTLTYSDSGSQATAIYKWKQPLIDSDTPRAII